MHRNRTWQIDPTELRTQRNRILPIEGGDGSTLNLNFTSGVLDPRLTFTRSSNATFINLSGYVEWTKSNLWLRSNELANASWTALNVTRVSSTDPNDGNTATEIIETAVNNVHALIQAVGSIRGMRYTASVYMKKGVNRTVGWIRDNNLGSDALIFYTLTGSGSYSIANGSYGITGLIERVGTGDWYRCIFSVTCAAGADANIQIGTAENTIYGSWSFLGVVGNSIHVWGAQAEMGFVARPLIVTTSTAKYDDPRFDYSPTTIGEPRGLLIEGQAINYLKNSSPLNGTGWSPGGSVTTTLNYATGPDGLTTATRLQMFYSGGAGRVYQDSGFTTKPYTNSVWIKSNTAGVNYTLRIWNTDGLGTGNITVTPTWQRFENVNTTGTSLAGYFYLENPSTNPAVVVDVLVWGAQLEAGSGASSYIPTGASQVTRNADSCVMTGTNFSSWFAGATEGVLFAEYERQRSQSGSTTHDFAAVGTRYSLGEGLIVYHANTSLYASAIVWPTGGPVFPSGITTAIPSVTKQALKWFAGNDGTNYSNGVVGSTGLGSGTVTPTMLSFGANSSNGTAAGRDWLNACVRKVKFFPTALSNAAIQSLTAP
jgi:hypothetical protein